ncbi:uncharacterized protein PODANS_3_10110 [Podospora anserina S mat+]|uniref:Podospora anserina S mat+ genomic DNA chromosome 3, supercontig 2 n=1 Tax=Podospora anserina (strain S / ATCC MYA-4624 / DSM 980 / FGSC 10383) TaxID=515849 RepID=B2B1H1_PODAN|nr:uncharacterized protein PODANS_3_10110 [Podospora anserina S mat+]CAP70956.1 unnamed protein product [Podospora anserina S mat+]CDP27551.1 Putative protein of unknown function [Podospora anserina S mat+]
MAHFLRSPREIWHRQIIDTGARLQLGSSDYFPFDALRHATDAFINRQGLVQGSSQCDSLLRELVLEHAARENGSERVGLVACLHALSHSVGTTLLVAMREKCQLEAASPKFLSCLTLGARANPLLISRTDSQVADILLSLLAGTDFLPAIKQLFQTLEEGPDAYILPPSYIIDFLNATDFSTAFRTHLDMLQQERKYMSLCTAVSWIRSVSNQPETSTAKIVASALVPDRIFWANWRPDQERLRNWEEGTFSETQRQKLCYVFDLEGPDITGSGYPCLKDSVPGCFNVVPVVNRDVLLLHRLLANLDNAQRIPGPHAINLVIHLCINSSRPLDNDLLSLTEAVLETDDDESIHSILMWLQTYDAGFDIRMTALTRTLPILEVYPNLQRLLSGYVSLDVARVMQLAREEYNSILETDVAENLAMRIHDFGAAIVNANWLHGSLPLNLWQSLQQLPPKETLDEIFEALGTSHIMNEDIRAYLRVVIGGETHGDSPPAEALLAIVRQTIRFYARGVEPERAKLATEIEPLRHHDPKVYDACIERILNEDIVLIKDMLPLVRSESHSSCVEFARLLAQRQQLRCYTHECWHHLLFFRLLQRRRDLLAWSAAELPLQNFVQWVHDLRALFSQQRVGGSSGISRMSLSDLGFTPERYQWWDVLQHQYGRAVGILAYLHQEGNGDLKWLWLQEIPDTTVLLDILQDENKVLPQDSVLMSLFQPKPDTLSLICLALAGLRRAAPQGKVALESICAREKQLDAGKWNRQATQVLSYCWRRSPDINTDDMSRNALWAFTALLGLGDDVDDQGLQVAGECLMADYANLVLAANNLLDMQVLLQSSDAARTAMLMEELGVEDAPPVEPFTPAAAMIPTHLTSFIEPVGEMQWELCFPLKKISAQKRQAIGIDPSPRLLLVRISLLDQQPAFCIHYHPSTTDDSNTRPHGLWHVSGLNMPDGTNCFAKPSLFAYLLSRRLSAFLSSLSQDNHISGTIQEQLQLDRTYTFISSILASPLSHCLACLEQLARPGPIPSTCGSQFCDETFLFAPLEVRAHHLLSDPPALDFLLSCVYSANVSVPELRNGLRAVIDSFPVLAGVSSSPGETLSRILSRENPGSDDGLSADRETLLSWMSGQFGGSSSLISAPGGSRLPAMQGVVQFILRTGDFIGGAGGSGNIKFIGSGLGTRSMWEILCKGLVVGGDGEAEERGEDEPPMDLRTCRKTKTTWKSSLLMDRRVFVACEDFGGVKGVVVRYVLLCPEGFVPPRMRVIGDALRQSFGALRAGRLVKE